MLSPPSYTRSQVGVRPFPEPALAAPTDTDDSISLGSLSVVEGTVVSVWAGENTITHGETDAEVKLRLDPQHPVVIGRQQGGNIPYLDPTYTSTPVLPHTNHSILTSDGTGRDSYVSRGHFMLRGSPQGIIFVNGVPRLGGGVRAPRNWTQLLHPEKRLLAAEEEYLIASGAAIKIQLPNDTVIVIRAE